MLFGGSFIWQKRPLAPVLPARAATNTIAKGLAVSRPVLLALWLAAGFQDAAYGVSAMGPEIAQQVGNLGFDVLP